MGFILEPLSSAVHLGAQETFKIDRGRIESFELDIRWHRCLPLRFCERERGAYQLHSLRCDFKMISLSREVCELLRIKL